jgi:hypothetical protein
VRQDAQAHLKLKSAIADIDRDSTQTAVNTADAVLIETVETVEHRISETSAIAKTTPVTSLVDKSKSGAIRGFGASLT